MKRILVIEDDAEVREFLREMLQRAGYEVVEASNGIEAAGVCRGRSPDLVISDILMPEKDGIETILELRRDSPDVKIIAISGGGRIGPGDYLHVAENLGVQHTFTKPFDRKEMLETIRELLDTG